MTDDPALASAAAQVREGCRCAGGRLSVASFFDEASSTATHVAHNPATGRAAIVDAILDFDPASGRTGRMSAQEVIGHVRRERLAVDWLLETHAHADHLSAAPYLQQQLGGRIGIGRGILEVQRTFGKVFNAGTEFARDGSEFDRLFDDGDGFLVGDVPALVLHVPGHTPADVAYVIDDAVFTGDTLFMPDYGTARADFPGGDARQLYRSIRRLLCLPDEARLFLCHDYKAPGRDEYAWETTVAAQRTGNVHVRDGVTEAEFVAMRTGRDAALPVPKLLLPAVQLNMRGGRLPPPEGNGTRYLKLPLDAL